MNIGKAIRTLRLKRKIQQQELAEEIDISQGYLSLVEKGEREPGFDLIKKIAHSLRVPPQLIFLMTCDNNVKMKRFKKPLRNILSAIDDILKAA